MTRTASTILHVDMDAFFLSVELLERPELMERSCLVAVDSGRSVVLSASYEARAKGIHSAMPLSRARAIDPGVVVIEPRHDLYYSYSEKVMAIFGSFTPLVEQLSVDEAFLDVAGAAKIFGSPLEIARQIRATIKAQLGLTASVGVATSKFVAKVASTQSKPDGLFFVPPEKTEAFLRGLPAKALWGVGAKSRDTLEKHGLMTIADVADADPRLLKRLLGEHGPRLQLLARGIDPRPVTSERIEKSLSADRTFAEDLTSMGDARTALLDIAHRLAGRLRRQGMSGKGISVKVRWTDFSQVQRSRQLDHPADSAKLIFDAAVRLTEPLVRENLAVQGGIRLLSIRVDHLVPVGHGQQFDVFHTEEHARDAEGAMDAVREKFGDSAITIAGILRGGPVSRKHEPPVEGSPGLGR
jgi:DNA polymerase-4